MIIITKKYNILNPPLFASGHYYSKNFFQFPITAVNQTISHTTALKNNNGITLLYFRDGQGKIIVNSKSYPIQNGTLICLGSYHYYQLKPSSLTIELIQCQLSYDTFLYMAANPYYRFSTITLNTCPLTALLENDELKRVEILLEEIIEITNKNLERQKISTQKDVEQIRTNENHISHKIGRTEFLLCMKLIGILHKNYQNNL